MLNMSSHKIVVGNWKMNKDYHQAIELVKHLTNLISERKPLNTTIVLSPNFLYIKDAIELVKEEVEYPPMATAFKADCELDPMATEFAP